MAAATAQFARTLRPLLPEAAFRPAPRRLALAGLHVAVVVMGWLAIRYLPSTFWPVAVLLIGVSLSAIAFLAHDAIHGSVVRTRPLRDLVEILLWSLLLMPRSVYKRVHHLHHRCTNSEADPDRRFLPDELTPLASAYGRMFFPNRQWRYGPLWFLHFIAYSIRHTRAALSSDPEQLSAMTAVPRYTMKERLAIALELAIILALQLAVWFLIAHPSAHPRLAYVCAVALPVIIMSAFVSFYFFTNHGLKPVSDDADVLAGSTSIAVPRLFNWLHSNFSYHVEHHLFPAMSSDYYPMVGELLRRHFPAQYHRVTAGDAWSALIRSEVAATRQNTVEAAPI
jgi:fatty acid desaturase